MTYTIKEVAEKMGVSVPTLRYYDKEGLMPFIEKKKMELEYLKMKILKG